MTEPDELALFLTEPNFSTTEPDELAIILTEPDELAIIIIEPDELAFFNEILVLSQNVPESHHPHFT